MSEGRSESNGASAPVPSRETREEALVRAYEIIADKSLSVEEQIDGLLEVVRGALETEYGTLSRIEGETYIFEQVTTPAGSDIEAGDTIELGATNCERVVGEERTLVLGDLEAQATDLAARAGNQALGLSSYIGAPVIVDGEVYGTFCFYDSATKTETFSEWSVTFVELLAQWVSGRFERQRFAERMVALNDLNRVVREVTSEAIDESTREPIEAVATETIAGADSWAAAWVVEATPGGALAVRTAAGTVATAETMAPEDGAAAAAIEQARETGESRFLHRHTGEGLSPFGGAAAGPLASLAAVPVRHADSVYGVLVVGSLRSDAFEGDEAEVIDHLGEVLGHAIAAADRKRALTSDTVVELSLEVPGAMEAWGVADPPTGPIWVDEFVPLDEGHFLAFGTTSAETLAAFADIVEGIDHWEDLVDLGARGDRVGFELRLTEPPILSRLASLGADLRSVTIEDGDLSVTVHLPTGSDVSQVVATVSDAFPDVKLRSKRQVTRPPDRSRRVATTLDEDLTERQREALRTAYFAGYYEWPRQTDGDELAEHLGVAPSTFHEHLRAAQNKLLGALLNQPS
jgi:GAF domain-containing protein